MEGLCFQDDSGFSMENKLSFGSKKKKYFKTNLKSHFMGSPILTPLSLPVYLDGLKSRDELYNQVFEDIHNKLLNCS